jgi:serine protease Do
MAHRRFFVAIAAAAFLLGACRAGAPGTDGPLFPQLSSPSTASPAPSPLPISQGDEGAVVEVVDRVLPAVVNVRSAFGGGDGGEGTGFIVRQDGVVVTNFHVVAGASKVSVITSDGDRFNARPIGGLDSADLAVLKIASQGLPTVDLGDSERLRLGETVVALGFALGLEGGPSVTSGIVSATGRTIQADGGAARYEDMIQTDAAINPGNSGGPLVNLAGQVVGINTAGVPAAQGENIGFAIAINQAKPIIDHAVENPDEPVAYLGVSTEDVTPSLAAAEGLSVEEGALIRQVVPGGPAEESGLQVDDVIVSIGGGPVSGTNDVLDRLLEHEPGEEVVIEVVRGEDTREIEVILGTRAFPLG